MSRIGKVPVLLPSGVKAKLEGNVLLVEGTKGKLRLSVPSQVHLALEKNTVVVRRQGEDKISKSLHGTIRALISNMIKGVSEGFKREMEIIGVGYKAQMKGNNLVLNVGFSLPIQMPVPSDLTVSLPKPNRIVVEGIDKQRVGEFAAQVRRISPPEPYKGKGIRYAGEEVRKKLGKALAK